MHQFPKCSYLYLCFIWRCVLPASLFKSDKQMLYKFSPAKKGTIFFNHFSGVSDYSLLSSPSPESVTDLKIFPKISFFFLSTSEFKLTSVKIGYQKWLKYILRWEPSPKSAFVKAWEPSLLILRSSILLHYIGWVLTFSAYIQFF